MEHICDKYKNEQNINQIKKGDEWQIVFEV